MELTAAPVLDALDGLSDDLVRHLFLRAPFATHGSLYVVCRRLKSLLRSREFLQQRVDSGLTEYGLVVAGGGEALDDEARAECSMLTSGRWRSITPLSGPRCDACSAVVENEDGQPEMWVMGGSDGGRVLATVEAYNPRTNTWRSCLPLSQRRFGAVAGVVGGRLVVAGGFDGGVRLTSVEAYTPTGWTPLPPLPHAATMATACVLNGRLYVMGGYKCNKLQVLEMSEENVSWTVQADLPEERYRAASAVIDGKLCLMGGYVNRSQSDSVSVYDTSSDKWTAGPALPRETRYCRAAILDGEVHVTSGAGTWRYDGAAWVGAGNGTAKSCAYESIILG